MFGESAKALTLHLSNDFHGLLLAALPPGAFIGLGLLVATKNWIDARLARPAKSVLPSKASPSAILETL
jgi:electron transport complex protein RnfE